MQLDPNKLHKGSMTEMVYNYLQGVASSAQFTALEIASEKEWDIKRVRQALAELKRKGYVEIIGKRRERYATNPSSVYRKTTDSYIPTYW